MNSKMLAIRARGPLACFTRPEAKAERLSYEVMTPSAARGVLEAILWKPALRWRVFRIHVLKPIRFFSFRRNEVGTRIPSKGTRSPAQGLAGQPLTSYFADDDRQQRHTVALRDVDYLIEARFELTNRAGPQDNVLKFEEMFCRRVEKGQAFQTPYLGCREFAAETLAVEARDGGFCEPDTGARLVPPEEIAKEDRRLGHMLFDLDFAGPGRGRPRFFEAELRRGVLVAAGQDALPRLEELG